MKSLTILASAAAFALSAAQAATVYSGIDENADDAYTDFLASLADYDVDDLTGLDGDNQTQESDAGNTFDALLGDFVDDDETNYGVQSGESLEVASFDETLTFKWTIAEEVNSFGFYVADLDRGEVDILYANGQVETFDFGIGDHVGFWGISGLDQMVMEVTFRATDGSVLPCSKTYWDTFVYGNTQPIPVPAALPLFAAGVAGFTAVSRRRRKNVA